ncbi:MAG TPA: cytochrome C oxidase subunit IV family protein [Pirellulaceae bacterium]|nr:cytochrome C oxidase subunit IV family protein [Pirellulaceae bacterium]
MADLAPTDPRYPGHGYDPLEHGDEHGHGHGPSGVGKYVIVFLVLLGLTAVSYLVGNSQTLREKSPGVMWAAMMAVSCAKAMLVILFFMHMLWEANWKYVLTIPASMMSIFLLLMLIPDVGRRVDRYSEERWLYAAQPDSNSHAVAKAAEQHGHDKAGKSDAAGEQPAANH